MRCGGGVRSDGDGGAVLVLLRAGAGPGAVHAQADVAGGANVVVGANVVGGPKEGDQKETKSKQRSDKRNYSTMSSQTNQRGMLLESILRCHRRDSYTRRHPEPLFPSLLYA